MSHQAENSLKVELVDLTEAETIENTSEESVTSESSSDQANFEPKEGARWVLPSSPWLNEDPNQAGAELENMVELEGEERNLVSAAGAAEGEMLFEGGEVEEFHTHEHSELDEEGHEKHEGENSTPPGDLLPTEPEFSLPSDSVPALSVPESGASQSNVSTISEGDTSGPQVNTPADSGAGSTISDPLTSPMSSSPPSTPDQSSLSDTKLLDMQPTSAQDSNSSHSDSNSSHSDSSSVGSDSSSVGSDSSSVGNDSSSVGNDSSSVGSDSSFSDSGANPTDQSIIEPTDHGQMSFF
jgi:hypothetical protein